jgi:putative transposase
MSTKYKFRTKDNLYFVSFSVVYWIDLFVREEYCNIVIDSLKFCQSNKGLEIYAWCIMSSHLHLIISSHNANLEDIMRDLKSHTSRELKKSIKQNSGESRKEWILWLMERAGKKNSNNKDFQLWQQDNHPIELSSNEMIEQKKEYIHNNPVKAGLVWEAEHYRYSSAIDYSGGEGLLNISIL